MPETPEEGTKRIRGDFKAGGILKALALFPCEYCGPDPETGKTPMVAEGSNCAKCRKFPSWPYFMEQVGAFHKAEQQRKQAERARRV